MFKGGWDVQILFLRWHWPHALGLLGMIMDLVFPGNVGSPWQKIYVPTNDAKYLHKIRPTRLPGLN